MANHTEDGENRAGNFSAPDTEETTDGSAKIGEAFSDAQGKQLQVLDTDGQGQYLVENQTGQLQVVAEKQLNQLAEAKPKKSEVVTPAETAPTETEQAREIQSVVDEKIADADIAEIAEETKIEIEEQTIENERTGAGKKLVAEFEARQRRIGELTERTKLNNIAPLSYRQIDNLFYALAIMQLSLKKMVLPIEKTQKYYEQEAAKLADPKLKIFETTEELKKDFELSIAELQEARKFIDTLSSGIDNHQQWWEAQKAKEDGILDEIYNPQTGEVDYEDLDQLPDRIIIALEEILENVHPPIKNPIESQEFFLNVKKTTEEFFKKMILDPARFFDKLIKKERELAIMAGRFASHGHTTAFAGAFAQFKNFTNKYVERFNNMLVLIGIKEEKLAYDYSPNYQGRAQKMKDLWAQVAQDNSEIIMNYRESLKTKNDTDEYDPVEEQLEKR